MRNGDGQQNWLRGVDLLVVAEGAHSQTNERLLNNRRITVLPSLPVIAAIFKDDRPSINGIGSLFQYVGKTLANTATSVYYYVIFSFKCLFQGEHIFNSNRKIAGTLILTTPNQNYLGGGLSRDETQEMMRIRGKLNDAKQDLATARERGAPMEQISDLENRVQKAQKEWDAYIRYWTGMSFCFANILCLFQMIVRGEAKWSLGSWLPLDHVTIAEIGADRSSAFSGAIGHTSYLIAGDTMATVDPTTGLGCNTAVKTVPDFHQFLAGINAGRDTRLLRDAYNENCERIVNEIHQESRLMRSIYRPDALVPTGNALTRYPNR